MQLAPSANRVVGVRASVLALAFAACALSGTPDARADARYSSVITAVTPTSPGLQISVVGSDEQLRLANRTGKTVSVIGYDRDQVGRVLADGTVEVNLSSPSYWANQDRMGGVPVPSYAKTGAEPQWKVLNKTGVFIWHDHRMHWMGKGTPPAVRDRAKRTLVWNYKIPLLIDGQPGTVDGKLWWLGESSGFPAAAAVSLGVAVLILGVAIIVARRKRGLTSG